MIVANFHEGGHSWEKTNLVTKEGKELYDTYQCRHCGLKAKMVSFGILQISERSRKKFERCSTAVKATQIRIIQCDAVGSQFANLTPGSLHSIINPPQGYDNKGGVWVMGVGEPVKVLFREFEYINQNERNNDSN